MTDERVIGIAVPARGRTRSQCEIRHADPGPCDCYAHRPASWPCVDRTGFRRRRHDFVVEGRDGRHCCWCGAKERMVRLEG